MLLAFFTAFIIYIKIMYLCILLRIKCSYAADIEKCNCNLISLQKLTFCIINCRRINLGMRQQYATSGATTPKTRLDAPRAYPAPNPSPSRRIPPATPPRIPPACRARGGRGVRPAPPPPSPGCPPTSAAFPPPRPVI
jgi:hypothetical protein